MDELCSPVAVRFSRDGAVLAAGFDKMIRVFCTDRPGRECMDVRAKRVYLLRY